MKKAISLFLALVMLVSVFAGLGITAYLYTGFRQ